MQSLLPQANYIAKFPSEFLSHCGKLIWSHILCSDSQEEAEFVLHTVDSGLTLRLALSNRMWWKKVLEPRPFRGFAASTLAFWGIVLRLACKEAGVADWRMSGHVEEAEAPTDMKAGPPLA